MTSHIIDGIGNQHVRMGWATCSKTLHLLQCRHAARWGICEQHPHQTPEQYQVSLCEACEQESPEHCLLQDGRKHRRDQQEGDIGHRRHLDDAGHCIHRASPIASHILRVTEDVQPA